MSKTLNQFLQETTVPPAYQHIADDWSHHANVDDETHEKMSNALDKGSFTHFPLDSGLSEADPDVVEHLNNHGWDVKDYQKGIAHKKTQVGNPAMGIPLREKMVEKKIGAILDETGASPEVKKTFTNDRGQTNASQQHVVISTSPLAILGMSTGTNWDAQSCMSVPNGSNKHYMRHDSENGTHIAYLVNSDDKTAFKYGEPEKPIARIALKPHHIEDEYGDRDTIFRPEDRTYGAGSTAFSRAVSNWAVKNYPAIKNARYEKNEEVYDDTGNNVYESIDKDAIEKYIDSGTRIVDPGTSIDHDVIDHGINHLIESAKSRPDRSTYISRRIRSLIHIGNLSTNHVAKLHKLSADAVDPTSGENITNQLRHSLAASHGDKFSTNALNELWNNTEDKNSFPQMAISSTKLPDNIVDQLPTNKYKFVRQQKIKDHHIDRVVDAYNNGEWGSFYDLGNFKNRLNSDHINKLIDGLHPEKVKDVFNITSASDAFSKEHHDKIMKGLGNSDAVDSFKSNIARESKYATFDEFKDKLGHLMQNTNLSDDENVKIKNEVMNRAMNHVHVKNNQWESDNPSFSKAVHRQFNSNLIPEHISKHMTDEDFSNLASKRFDVNFENAEHSNKYLDKIAGHALDIDDAINDHIDHKMSTEDEYDPDEDEHVQKMKDNLNLHMEAYANNIGNHIDDHVTDEAGGSIKNFKEHQKTYDRISGIGKTSLSYFDHYMSPHHSDYDWRSDVDHYNDHFAAHEEKLNELETNHDEIF
jgi:hypothetical protein